MGMLDSLDAEQATFNHNVYHDPYAGGATATAMAAAAAGVGVGGVIYGQQQQQQHHHLQQHAAAEKALRLTHSTDVDVGNNPAAEGTSTAGGGGHNDMDAAAASAAVVGRGRAVVAAISTTPAVTHHHHAQNDDQLLQQQQQQQQQEAVTKQISSDVHAASMATSIDAYSCKSPKESEETDTANANGNDDLLDSKKQSRVERKRSREKQRRLDTNSQFTALADIVREVETSDFVEEAQYNLNKQYGSGKGNGGGDDALLDQHLGAPASTSESTSADNGSAKKLKSNNGDPLLQPPPLPAFNPANRVDLIARTIAQLTQFRIIRRRRNEEIRERNEEVRDVKRQNCELRKECEELRRLVAHYKAVGMGAKHQKPQEKVMMMVPMMVPHDAVNQIANGYPASHQYANNSSPHYFQTPPWMSQAAVAPHHNMATSGLSNMGMTAMHHHHQPTQQQQHPTMAQQQQQHPGNNGMNHHMAATTQAPSPANVGGQCPAPAPGAMTLPPHLAQHPMHQNVSALSHLRQFSGGHSTSMPPPSNNAPQQPPRDASNAGNASPGIPVPGQQLPPPQVTQGQAVPSPYAPVAHTMQMPQTSIHPSQPPTVAMYPQVSNGIPNVAFGLHPHAHHPAHTVTTALHPHGTPPPAAPPGAQHASAVQQPQQQQVTNGSNNPHPSAQPPSSEKPTAHQGGGGNLAHCA